LYPDFGIYAEAIDRKIRERNAERHAAWCRRVCAGIDAARRAPVTAAELRERTERRHRGDRNGLASSGTETVIVVGASAAKRSLRGG
jgi:hypothetical protein